MKKGFWLYTASIVIFWIALLSILEEPTKNFTTWDARCTTLQIKITLLCIVAFVRGIISERFKNE